jgi:hypothetical protein
MIRFAAVLSMFLIPLIAAADHPRHHPPQAAIDACANAKRGDRCSVTIRDHAITGTCDAPPDAPLACRPDGPPPEAIAACDGAKEGDACTVQLEDRAIHGTCAHGPDASKPRACRPE